MRYAFDLQRGQAIGAMSVGMKVNGGFLGGRGMARSPLFAGGSAIGLSATGRLQVGPWPVMQLFCAFISRAAITELAVRINVQCTTSRS
jgi:hypothetical protein